MKYNLILHYNAFELGTLKIVKDVQRVIGGSLFDARHTAKELINNRVVEVDLDHTTESLQLPTLSLQKKHPGAIEEPELDLEELARDTLAGNVEAGKQLAQAILDGTVYSKYAAYG